MNKKIYQTKKFNNPYFAKKKPKMSLKQNKKWLALFGIFAVFLTIYIIGHLNALRITKIEVSGNQFTSQDEINLVIQNQLAQRRFFIFSQENILFFNKYQAKKSLNHLYSFQSLKIIKRYPNTIAITVKEKATALIFVNNNGRYNLDANGLATKKYELGLSDQKEKNGGVEIIRPLNSAADFPVLVDQSNAQVEIGQMVVPKETVSFIISLQAELNKNFDFDVLQYSLTNPQAQDLFLTTDEGWELRLKTTDAISRQIYLLNLVLQEKIKDRRSLHYIDLRFGDKINYQ